MRVNYQPALDWVRHHHLVVAAICTPFFIASTWFVDENTPRYVAVLQLIPVVAWVWVLVETYLHPHRMCDRCIHTFIVDGEQKALRRRRLLRAEHFMIDHSKAVLGYILVGLIAGTFLPAPWWQIVNTVVSVSCLVLVAVGSTHTRYLRWCPWCRDAGGDGDHEFIPDPVERERVR
ncbi:hypothetical protein NONO_c60030 [Nocardia nova SH22a]|uniref:Uncharacterized protein n=1 Tax=Nocardia nova SH22a TaxID=1415166 RepID=W5TNN7_9NOCA|nr:hypothetical protein [Nocardia nova]AHH20779.1 hypothetical protein NONO_c60030 [Nocardia nova SH22a]